MLLSTDNLKKLFSAQTTLKHYYTGNLYAPRPTCPPLGLAFMQTLHILALKYGIW